LNVTEFFLGLRRIEWVILRLKTPQSWGLQGAFAFLQDLNLASLMDGASIETSTAALGYVFVSWFSTGTDGARDLW
jgi:hypothetical protein